MNAIEFHSIGDAVIYRTDEGIYTLKESSGAIINRMFEIIKTDYPSAYQKLLKLYGKISDDQNYIRFRMVQRFCRCNFGVEDNKNDVTPSGRFNLEHVPCPLSGECYERGVICRPKFNSRISKCEYRIIEAFVSGNLSRGQIAEKLMLAPSTVNNHIAAVYKRLGFTSKGELVAYWKDNNLGNSKN